MGLGMGFNMNNMLIALSSFLILGFNISCLKKQNLDDQNLGPVVAASEVQEKMSEAIGVLDFGDIKVNEFSSVTSSITLEDSQNIKLFKQDLRVKSITNTSTEFSVDFIQSIENFRQTELSFSNIEKNYNPFNQKISNPSNPSTDDPMLLPVEYFFIGKEYCSADKVTCHNLTLTPVKTYLNPSLIDPKICPNSEVCEISARKIEFDMLNGNKLNDQGKPSRSHYTFIVAGQLPFLSKVLQYCVRGLINYGNRKVLAESCYFVNSFYAGN